jgi:acetaldehyde dehydrogenase / alcohol dehydrogenase
METNAVMDRVNEFLGNAKLASAVFTELDQAHTDRIVKAVYQAAFDNRVKLAKMAAEETQLGIWEHKVIKNVVASQLVYEDIKDLKTVGVISEDEHDGIIEIAQPLGPILAISPMTNPTSTVIFKILLAMKTRNPIIISPHRRALKCSIEAARICYDAAMSEDAPEHCIQWIAESSREQTHGLMSHPDMALILATGGGSLVNAAYSSGTPAIGVGAGNVPVCIERSADIPFAVSQIIYSKTFDNGTICASEQAIVVEKSIEEEVVRELEGQGAYMLSEEECVKLEPIVFNMERGLMQADIVGQPATKLAEMAGITVPDNTVLLIGRQTEIGKHRPLSSEILAPVLALYVAEGFYSVINTCIDLNYHGGIGHTASIYSNDNKKIMEFASQMNAGRIVVNTPSSQGAVGGIFNTLHPSMTLGCGSGGKNITTDNVTATHLLNIQRVARRRNNDKFLQVDINKYLDESLTSKDLEYEYHKNS